jgi:hypothetical protein
MHNCVENNYGYPTPSQTLQMYHPNEIKDVREEAIKCREENMILLGLHLNCLLVSSMDH